MSPSTSRTDRSYPPDCQCCYEEISLPPEGQPEAWYLKLGICSEVCGAHYIRQRLEEAGVPPRYRELRFSDFDPYTLDLEKKLQFVRDWASGPLSSGLLMFGPVGTGKSHLAVACIRKLFVRGIFGQYVNGRSYILRCQGSFTHDETVEELADELLSGNFLVIDDLGSEKPTDFAKQCLLHLVDQAYALSIPLVVTSNLSLEQWNRIEPRLASRLVEMCELCRFDGPDYRVRLAQERGEADQNKSDRKTA